MQKQVLVQVQLWVQVQGPTPVPVRPQGPVGLQGPPGQGLLMTQVQGSARMHVGVQVRW